MKGKNICGIANSIPANAGLLVTSFPRYFFPFWYMNVAIILCAINVSENKNWIREASDFVHLKHWERTMYYISNQKRCKYFFVNNLRIRLPSRMWNETYKFFCKFFLFYYMSCNFSFLLVCYIFSLLDNVCKHFILFMLEAEPLNVKLYAENFCKHDHLLI